MPSYSEILPVSGSSVNCSKWRMSASRAPSNTGVANGTPSRKLCARSRISSSSNPAIVFQTAVGPNASLNHFRTPPARFLVEELPDLLPQFFRSPAEMRFENLSDVHTGRNTERVQHDFYRRAIRHVGHVFLGNDARDDALVTVASRHLVAHGKLALHGDVALHQLDHAWRKFVAFLQLSDALIGDLAQHIDLARGHFFDLVDLFDEQRVFVVEPQALQVARGHLFKNVARQFSALDQQLLVGAFVVQVSRQ